MQDCNDWGIYVVFGVSITLAVIGVGYWINKFVSWLNEVNDELFYIYSSPGGRERSIKAMVNVMWGWFGDRKIIERISDLENEIKALKEKGSKKTKGRKR